MSNSATLKDGGIETLLLQLRSRGFLGGAGQSPQDSTAKCSCHDRSQSLIPSIAAMQNYRHLATALAVGTLLIAVGCQLDFGPSTREADEIAVRCAYRATVLRSQMFSLLSHYPMQTSTESQVTIKLSHLRAVSGSEIRSRALSHWITVPSDEIVTAVPTDISFNNQFLGSALNVEGWAPASRLYGPNPHQLFGTPMTQPRYDRCVQFTVHLGVAGKQRSYQALGCFLGENTPPRIVDLVLGSSAVLDGNQLLPQLVRLPQLLSKADPLQVRGFLQSLVLPDPCTVDKSTGLCCNLVTKACGIPQQGLEKSYASDTAHPQ